MAEQPTSTPSTNAFSEYVRFDPPDEQGKAERNAQNQAFQEGKVTNPQFVYPKLEAEDLPARENAFVDAIAGTTDEAKRNLLEARLKGVEIAKSSLGLVQAGRANDHAARWQAGQQFVENNEKRYFKLRPELFWPVLAERSKIAEDFRPANLHASMAQERLLKLLPKVPEGTSTHNIIDRELLDKISPEILEHIAPILAQIPEKGDFNSDEIAAMTNKALEAMGLADKGWKAVQSSEQDAFKTARSTKEIVIPNPKPKDGKPYTKSADDLRRLLSHEIGVHAMFSDEAYMDPDMEEGMGMLVECVAINSTNGPTIKRADDRYLHIGLTDGIDGTPRNARQVFEITWRLEALSLAQDGIISPEIEAKAKNSVQPHIDNVFRGTDHKLPGVHYYRAKLYKEGLFLAAEYAKKHAHEKGWLPRVLSEGLPKADHS